MINSIVLTSLPRKRQEQHGHVLQVGEGWRCPPPGSVHPQRGDRRPYAGGEILPLVGFLKEKQMKDRSLEGKENEERRGRVWWGKRTAKGLRRAALLGPAELWK